jgi:4'-phosphopantetheinyl transferase
MTLPARIASIASLRPEPGMVRLLASRLRVEPESVHAAQALLSHDELSRAKRFAKPELQARFTLTRAWLRSILAAAAGCDARAFAFHYGSMGKPELGEPFGWLNFNVSHSGDIVLLALADGIQLGVDVEQMVPLEDIHGLAASCFSETERQSLHACAPAQRETAFYHGWTRKEAWIKATGQGLTCSLQSFDVEITPGAPPRYLRLPGHALDEWTLAHFDPAPGYVAALAVRAADPHIMPLIWI